MDNPVPSPRDAWVEGALARLSLEQQVGQLIVQYVYGADADEPDSRNLERYGVATPAEVVARYHLGGVIYFAWSDNTAEPARVQQLSSGLQRAALDACAGVPLDLSVDQETGRVTRFGPPVTEFPGAMALGAGGSIERTRDVFAVTGAELAAMGVTTDFAPDADVNVDPDNPVIGVRSFASRPEVVAEHVVAAIEGLHRGGVAAVAKHFPGHGDTGVDSHTALPVIDHSVDQWRELDRPPFAAAIGADVDAIMTAHIAFPELDSSGDPATLSAPILRGLLRAELGYQGLVITDSLQMAGVRARYDDGEIAVRAVEAGVDVLLMPADPVAALRALLRALESGRITIERLQQSVRRVLQMKFDRQIDRPANGSDPLSSVGCAEHLRIADEVAAAGVTLLGDDKGLVPIGDRTVTVLGVETGPRNALARALTTAGVTASDGPVTADLAGLAADLIVLLVADLDDHPELIDVAETLTGSSLILVAIKDPQDVTRFGATGTVLLTYSPTDVAMRGLASVLRGERIATGQLPVDLAITQKIYR